MLLTLLIYRVIITDLLNSAQPASSIATLQPDVLEPIPPLEPLEQKHQHLGPTMRHPIEEHHVGVDFIHRPQLCQ